MINRITFFFILFYGAAFSLAMYEPIALCGEGAVVPVPRHVQAKIDAERFREKRREFWRLMKQQPNPAYDQLAEMAKDDSRLLDSQDDENENRNPPLVVAVEMSNNDLLQMLVEARADLSQKNSFNTTALVRATELENHSAMDYLLRQKNLLYVGRMSAELSWQAYGANLLGALRRTCTSQYQDTARAHRVACQKPDPIALRMLENAKLSPRPEVVVFAQRVKAAEQLIPEDLRLPNGDFKRNDL